MADIAKCSGVGCTKKETCYRYLAPESEMQSYMLPEVVESCEMYWKVKVIKGEKYDNNKQGY